MDYQVFLVSRMREAYVHGAEPSAAIGPASAHSARVVTAAGLIMIAVFSGFILGDDPIIKSIGFALAIGVLVDAFVVRMTLVPADDHAARHAAWWLPAGSTGCCPNVDIEGENLEHHPAPTDP